MICKHKNCGASDHWDNVIDVLGPYNAAFLFDGIDNWASHIFIYPYDPKTEKYVQLFHRDRYDASFMGIFPLGQYDSEDIKHHHVDKGGYWAATSSVIVPSGLTVTLFKGDYYSSESLTLIGPRMVDFVNGDHKDWNDQTRSLIVRKTEEVNVSTYWKRVLSNSGPISESIEIGWSKEESKTDESTVTNTFTMAVEQGYSFMGDDTKVTLTYSVSS